ncbi:TPA: RHS repeat-associated core domain-containing protein, partial [Salmonella enterica subsp. enterica serovar Grumpensis]
NTVAWRGEYDEWGNLSGEENPEHLEQLIRLPGQQYDEESGLYYNRYRYYNPGQGRYITQDPIGLMGGWNLYKYPLNPMQGIDPLGLDEVDEGEIFSEFFSDPMPPNDSETTPKSTRPDGQPWGYGCGSEGSDWFVPDGLWGVSFMDACRNHDKCYATKGSDKTTCDVNLGNDIALACGVLKSEDPRYNDIYTQCLITSAAYRVAVGTFGKGAYNDAQAGAE